MPKINERKRAAVRRANDALFAGSSKVQSQSLPPVPSSSRPPPPPPAPLVPPVPEDSEENQLARESSPSYATLESALETLIPEIAFNEGWFLYKSERAGSSLFYHNFAGAFLYIDPETGARTWRVDTDLVDVATIACLAVPDVLSFVASKDPITGNQILTDTDEDDAIESFRQILLRSAQGAISIIPEKPDFSTTPLADGIKFFIFLGAITIRAYIRGKARLNTSILSISPEQFATQRHSFMAEQANLIIVDPEDNSNAGDASGVGESSNSGDISGNKARKRREKRARQRANKAAKAKEDEEAKKEVTEGDSEVKNNDDAAAATTTEEEETCTCTCPHDEEPINVPAGIVSTMAAMVAATRALSVYGARPPVGLSQQIGMPTRRSAVPPRQLLASEIEALLAETSHLPRAQRRRAFVEARERLLRSETVAAARRQFDIGGMPGWLGELEAMQAEGLRGGKGKGKEAEK